MELKEWRALREEGEPATLPSGLDVRLRRVNALDLATQGRIPQELHPQLDQFFQQGKTKANGMTLEEFKEFSGLIDIVCMACIVAPAGLEATELPYEDRLAIFTWANEVSGKLKPFRRTEEKPVDVAFAVGDVRPEAKRVSGAGR